MNCLQCGKGSPEGSKFCLHCGAALTQAQAAAPAAPSAGAPPVQPPGAPPAGPAPTSGKAIASLVLGLCGLLCGIAAIVGLIFGIVALSDIKKSGGRLEGRGLATAGIVVSVVVLILSLAAWIFLLGLSSYTVPAMPAR